MVIMTPVPPRTPARPRLCSPDSATPQEVQRWVTGPRYEGSIASPLPSREAECPVAPFRDAHAPRVEGDRVAHTLMLTHPEETWGLFCYDCEGCVAVHGVAAGSPAAAAGLRAGDVLATVQGLAVAVAADIAEIHRAQQREQTRTVVVVTAPSRRWQDALVGVEFPTAVPVQPVIRHARDQRYPSARAAATPHTPTWATAARRDPLAVEEDPLAPPVFDATPQKEIKFGGLKWGIPAPPERTVEGLFRRLGRPGSDTLTRAEFMDAMKDKAVAEEFGWPGEQAEELFGYLDEDGSGIVEVEEMQRFLAAQQIFYRIDEDHQGTIDKFEFRDALTDPELEQILGVRWEDAHLTFAEIDEDLSGEIEFTEFLAHFRGRLLADPNGSEAPASSASRRGSAAHTTSRRSSAAAPPSFLQVASAAGSQRSAASRGSSPELDL